MPTSTRIKEIREREGYSRKDLAKEYDMPYSTLTNYENGTRKPPYDFLLRMAEEFGTTVDYLLCYTDSPNQGGGNAGLFGETEMWRGFDILLKNIGFMYYSAGKYYICKFHDGEQNGSCEITREELEQLFSSVVDFTRFTATSLYDKALLRENEKRPIRADD